MELSRSFSMPIYQIGLLLKKKLKSIRNIIKLVLHTRSKTPHTSRPKQLDGKHFLATVVRVQISTAPSCCDNRAIPSPETIKQLLVPNYN